MDVAVDDGGLTTHDVNCAPVVGEAPVDFAVHNVQARSLRSDGAALDALPGLQSVPQFEPDQSHAEARLHSCDVEMRALMLHVDHNRSSLTRADHQLGPTQPSGDSAEPLSSLKIVRARLQVNNL